RWLDEGKFGIYTHWGVYSVPACGPNGSWYPHNMYREGTQQYEYHVQHYGHPSKFGYKDFIPMFKAEKFDPEEWAELFKAAGARFAGPVAEHHDGFSMWDSDVNEWNAARMGPQRDIVGELEKSIRKRGMKFMVAFHHAENWWYYPHWRKEFDVSDPKYSGLYGPIHNQDAPSDLKWEDQDPPNEEFLEKWKEKIREVIDKYKPDLIWFDFGLQFIQEKYKREIIAYYFNKASEWNTDVTICYKDHSVPPGIGVIDYELGRESELTYHRWITDTDIAIGGRWSYVYGIEYKSTDWLIHYLVDNVSKNGYLLLNVGPKANGEIPEPAKQRLREMGEWLKLNGEAIYGTSPWVVYGEGPTKMTLRGEFTERAEVFYTAEDIRFTVKNNVLYAILLGWPGEGKEITIKSLRILYPGEVHSVSMLGVDGELKWSQSKEGLKVKMPNEKPCEHAYVIKIERE
ncbi:MAG: alpha-L-fucosidase, partial [Thermoproteota archaeon]